MMLISGVILVLLLQIWKAYGQCDASTQNWDYVDVRPGAHMFYWLYETTHSDGPANRPLVIWLQGGPGGSSVGYGNFDIIGPLRIDLTPRNTTWVQQANVLFIDSPVGAGYSYVENGSDFTSTTEETVDDLLTFIKVFYQENPAFQSNEVYIFGQSYGGKIAAATAQRFYNEIQAGNLDMTLAGFAMGNSWVHPVDSTTNWGEFLYWMFLTFDLQEMTFILKTLSWLFLRNHEAEGRGSRVCNIMSNLDEKDQEAVDQVAMACKAAADAGNWELATDLWAETEYVIWDHTNYIDFYNVLKYVVFTKFEYDDDTRRGLYDGSEEDYVSHRKREVKKQLRRQVIHGTPDSHDELDDIMNDEVKTCLGNIPEEVVWGAQSDAVFEYQEGDFMKPVVDIVGDMVNNTNLDVIVYQGQLDLICLNAGAMQWVKRLAQYWDGFSAYFNKDRIALVDVNGQTDTFVKSHGNFKFYDNLRAGHAVPKDDGEGALRMLVRILDQVDT